MSHLGKSHKPLLFIVKKVEKKAKKGLTSPPTPVGWIRKVRKEVNFTMKGQTLC